MMKQCIYLVIQIYFMQTSFYILDLGINFQIFLCFRINIDPTRNVK